MKSLLLIQLALMFFAIKANGQPSSEIRPSRIEVVSPIHKKAFNLSANGTECQARKQGGSFKIINGWPVFNGFTDGFRQVDPQIAVGGGYVLHGTNLGMIAYKKNGEFVQGVQLSCFNEGIDPKMFYDIHNKCFVFDIWPYWVSNKPVNFSVSETNDPLGPWNIYPIPSPDEVDGGDIGYSKKWIGYSFPCKDGKSSTLVIRTSDAKAGKPVSVYFFNESLGIPVFNQDNNDDLYFFTIANNNFIIRKVVEDSDGKPYCVKVSDQPHYLKYINYPPLSPQKESCIKVASGTRNPKNLVLQNGSIWFSHAVDYNGHSAVQWHEINSTNGKIIQTGIINNDTSNFIHPTIAVNKYNDVLIGFQQVGNRSFISPRFAYRLSSDTPGTLRDIQSAGEGNGPTNGTSWGDYSGSLIDGDNLIDLWTIQSIANDRGCGETVIVNVPYKKLIEGKEIMLLNKETNRYLLSSGEPISGARGDEDGWTKSPPICASDANYYDRAIWYLEKNSDGSFFIINRETNRYLLSDGQAVTGARGNEGGWLKSPKVLGADANYYNRARWYFEKNDNGTYLIRNQETNRYLFSDGNVFSGSRGVEGGWLKSPSVLGTDANYYNRAQWSISGAGVKMIGQ